MSTTVETASLLLPEGTRLVHIGPPKTGTTSLQSAFHVGRAAISEQGVHYTGANRQPTNAVRAVIGLANPMTGKPPKMKVWQDLVREVDRASEPRVVISSEFFSRARAEAIKQIVADLGGDRVHIVVTLRPLARIISSQWQQNVQNNVAVSFDDWLDAMFNEPDSKLATSFWLRHRHDKLIARWAKVVGPSNVTVVALDEKDHGMVLRVFEGLVGLREGTLVPDRDLNNRSMTMPEIEVVRAFNSLFQAEGLSGPLHKKVMTYGAGAFMKRREPGPDEPRIETPQWALDRAGEVAREMIDAIVASDVRIVGDPEGLTKVPGSRLAGAVQPEVSITPEIAASAAMGMLIASGLARGATSSIPVDPEEPTSTKPGSSDFVPRPTTEPLELVRISTPKLTGVLVRRVRVALAVRKQRLLRRLRGEG